MVSIAPNTELEIFRNVEFDAEYKNVLPFKSVAEREEYFRVRRKYRFDDFSYQRDNGAITVPLTVENLIDCNYIRYKNTAFENKWFYAFILEKPKYVSNGASQIVFEEDVFQTWYSAVTLRSCFVSQEHVVNDEIGLHLEDEGLELGDYIYNDVYAVCPRTGYYPVIIGALNIDCQDENNIQISKYNFNTIGNYNFFQGIGFTPIANSTLCGKVLAKIQELAYDNAILQITYIPKEIGLTPNVTWMGGGLVKLSRKVPFGYTDFNGYVPKNNKLLCYPYKFDKLTNGQGQEMIIKREFLRDKNNINIGIYYGLEGNPLLTGVVEQYRGLASLWNERVTLTNIPVSAYMNDTYKTWWAQNSILYAARTEETFVNTAANIAPKIGDVIAKISAAAGAGALAGSVVPGVGTGVGAGSAAALTAGKEAVKAIKSAFGSVAKGVLDYGSLLRDQMAQKKVAQVNSLNVNYTSGSFTDFEINAAALQIEKLSITREFAEKIDNYFTRYGYKVNAMKVPDTDSRKSWNYVKTVGCNVKGNVPQYVLEKINSIFDGGVTLWHTPGRVGDYDQDNSIVGNG